MMRLIQPACALLFILSIAPSLLQAQQSAKSKSKDRFREKDDPTNVVRVENSRFLNSEGNDYSPVYYKNGLAFVTSRAKNAPMDKKTGQPYSQIYFAPFDPNGEPIAPGPFSLEINSSLHEGPVSFSRDFQYMFFTRNNMHKGVRKADGAGKVRLKIYMARRGPIDWTDVRELPFNSDNYSCLHPSLSPDGKTLYFASDMDGGFGGFDLYKSEYKPGGWSEPLNLGPEINSAKNELFPYIHFSGTLFFASNGHNSLGGLDLFFVDKNDAGDIEIVNLGEPFNTKFDDLGFIMNDEGTKGFFASDRENGYGKDDIFSFSIEKGIEGVEKPVAIPVDIVVTDATTGKPLQGAAIRILKPSEDGFVSSNQQAYYDIDLAPLQDDQSNVLSLQLVRKNADDLGPADLLSNAGGQARYEFLKYRSYLVLVSRDGYQTAERLFSLENEETGPLKIDLRDAPVCYRAGGIVSTDQFGTRIANAAIRFTHKASGNQVKVRTNLNGEYDACLPQDGEYLVEIERDGFYRENVSLVAFKGQEAYKEVRLRPTEMAMNKPSESLGGALQPGSVIVMDKIRYEHNKATLNQTAVRHLDALFDLLQRFPNMQIELIGHTDARGEAETNLALSKERAQNGKAYLVYRGIAENRIQTDGLGESQIRNRCTDGVNCAEEEHQANVRFEVRIRQI